jgi:hypothetical protein
VLLDSGFRRNDGFWTFDELINIGAKIDKMAFIPGR